MNGFLFLDYDAKNIIIANLTIENLIKEYSFRFFFCTAVLQEKEAKEKIYLFMMMN